MFGVPLYGTLKLKGKDTFSQANNENKTTPFFPRLNLGPKYFKEGDIGICGIAVLVNFSCGISVILILNCVIAVFSESAG